MRAIVTGGAGFIGAHLAQELVREHADVHVIDNLESGYVERIPSGTQFHHVSVCSEELGPLVARLRPDIVFHLAAQADVTTSIHSPWHDAATNIAGTIQLLEAAADASVQKFIFASTSAVYGQLAQTILRETDPAEPISYYGLSKLTGERYIAAYRRYRKLQFTILRYGNVYGPGQTPKGEGAVIAVFMERIARGEPLVVHGDGNQTRDFVYVQDVVRANLAAVRLGEGGTYHVGTGIRTSINDIVRMLHRLAPDIQVTHADSRVGDIEHSCLDVSRTLAHLQWSAACDIETGLKLTYRWMREASGRIAN